MLKLIDGPPTEALSFPGPRKPLSEVRHEGPYSNIDPSTMKLHINDFGVSYQNVGENRFRRDSDFQNLESQLD